MNAQLTEYADSYFHQHLNTTLEELTNPINEQTPCGPDLRDHSLFDEIVNARKADDPSLPQGAWEVELKRADWSKVTDLAADAISFQSKDLQLSAWLLEAEIKQRSFGAIAPCLMLIQKLAEDYWPHLNPAINEIERRYNIFLWIDEKLPIVINQLSIASSLDQAEVFTGADLDRAMETEHLIETKKIDESQIETALLKHINEVVERTDNNLYAEHYRDINKAMQALNLMEETLDNLFGRADAPGFSSLRKQLDRSLGFFTSELDKRGILEEIQATEALTEKGLISDSEIETETGAETKTEMDNAANETDKGLSKSQSDETKNTETNSLLDRQGAYQQLADIAHYLARIEPHSPVPYLVMRAVDWGSYNTAELYQNLFLVNKGQIDLFEIMGITDHQEDSNAGA